MAGYRGHLAGATVAYVIYFAGLAAVFAVDQAYAQLSDWEILAYPLSLFAICLLFGLWPDVDTNSKGQDIFYTLFFLCDVLFITTGRYEEAAYLGLFAILPILGKHRGWTHTYWAMLLIPSPLFFLPYLMLPERPLLGLPFYAAAVVGYFSHLFMDGMVIRLPKRLRPRRSSRGR